MASTATSALTSLAPANSKLASRLQTMAVPQSVGLPSLPPTSHGASPSCSVGARSWKAASYCRRVARDIVARAAGEAPAELAFDLPEFVKSIQDAWNRIEDKYAMTSLAAAGFIGLWVTNGVISAVDRLPLAPSVFELVGIGYTAIRRSWEKDVAYTDTTTQDRVATQCFYHHSNCGLLHQSSPDTNVTVSLVCIS